MWHFLIHCRWKLGSVLVLVSLLVGLEVTEGMFVLQLFALGGVSLARVLSLLVGCAHQDGLLAGGLDGIDPLGLICGIHWSVLLLAP